MSEKSIGALWLKESKNGNKYMSGVIEIDGKKHEIVIFKNTYKQEKQPDYKIFASRPRPENEIPQ
jgi:uncharacterized protein (DUF736 family)